MYTIHDLGTAGGTQSYASQINENGTIIGTATTANNQGFGFLWRPDTVIQIPTLGGNTGGTTSVNDAGHVVGISQDSSGRSFAYLWKNDMLTNLGTLPGGYNSSARGINNHGVVVGSASSPGGSTAFQWQNGAMTALSLLPDRIASIAMDINDTQVVVGTAIDTIQGYARYRAVRWVNGNMEDLGANQSHGSSAAAVNNAGKIAGQYATDQGFLWHNGAITDLGTLGGFSTNTRDINDHDQVVGGSYTADNNHHAFIWENGVMSDLNDRIDPNSGWLIEYARGINNRGQIAATGVRNNQRHALLLSPLSILIRHPSGGERFHVEQRDTLRWLSAAVSFFLLEYSTDNGRTYHTIDATTGIGDTSYVWTIPDSIRSSSQCKIRISDVLDQTVFAETEVFTIKANDLAEMRPGNLLEPFDPYRHGWAFRNDTTGMWPHAWWTQFDYVNVDDPHTGAPYPDYWTQAPIKARRSNFPDWPLFAETFGTDQCYLSTFFASYKQAAKLKWAIKKSRWKGSCYGFATSSLLAFEQGSEFLNQNPGVPRADSISNLFMTSLIRKTINRYYIHQFGQGVLDNDLTGKPKTPRDLLFEVRQMFRDENLECRVLSFNEVSGSGAHSVLPYRLLRDPLNTGQFRLFVYDSNNPLDNSVFIYIDSTANTWTDSTGLNWGSGSDHCYLEPPGSAFLQTPVLSLPGSGAASGNGVESITFVEIYAPGAADVMLTNPSGQSIGHIGGTVFSTLGEGMAMIPKVGREAPPDGYYVRSDAYAIQMHNIADTLAYLSVISDSQSYGYYRTDAQAGQHDDISTGNGFSLRNPDTGTRRVFLQALLQADSSDRSFELQDLDLAAGDSLHMADHQHNALTVVNAGGIKHYNLRLTAASPAGEEVFEYRGIQLAGGAAQRIVPSWDDLGNRPVKILVDPGNDGTFEDSLFVNHQPAGVEDAPTASLPAHIELHQNYPNPFNPVTNIEFGIPKSEWVELTIYDILGKVIATLVNEQKPAGRYHLQWRGVDDTGAQVASGIYFYRLQAGGPLVQTRRMLLVR